jgi:hypothetical protein
VTDIWWSATSPASGRFDALETRSDVRGLASRFDQLRAQDQGYVEVRRDDDFPVLTLGFRAGLGVVQLMADETSTSLLIADRPAEEDVMVLVMDDLVEFHADFAFGLDRAWLVVQQFARTGVIPVATRWFEL